MSKEMIKWIQYAIDTEEKGLAFYKECRTNVKNPRGIELFDFLIKVENAHKNILTMLLTSVSKGDKDIINKGIAEFLKMDIHNPLFDRATLKKVTEPNAQVLDMFNTAVDLEVQGIQMYSDLAKEEKDPNVKKLLERLAADELLHKKEIIDLGHFVFGMAVPSDHVEEGHGY